MHVPQDSMWRRILKIFWFSWWTKQGQSWNGRPVLLLSREMLTLVCFETRKMGSDRAPWHFSSSVHCICTWSPRQDGNTGMQRPTRTLPQPREAGRTLRYSVRRHMRNDTQLAYCEYFAMHCMWRLAQSCAWTWPLTYCARARQQEGYLGKTSYPHMHCRSFILKKIYCCWIVTCDNHGWNLDGLGPFENFLKNSKKKSQRLIYVCKKMM